MISKYRQKVKLQSFLADRCTDSQIIQINVTEAQILFDQWCGTEVSKKVVCWDRWNFNAKSSQKCSFVYCELFINSFAQLFHKWRNSAVHERLLPKFILLKICFPILIGTLPLQSFCQVFPYIDVWDVTKILIIHTFWILWILYLQDTAYSLLKTITMFFIGLHIFSTKKKT